MSIKVFNGSFYKYEAIEPALDRLQGKADVIMGNELGRSFTEDEIIEHLKKTGAQIAIAADEPYGEKLFKAVPSLMMVCRDGVGYNAIDLEAAARYGVIATNAPVLHETAADLAMGLIIAMMRKMIIADWAAHNGEWLNRDLMLGSDVYGSTLGILGFGRIGQAVARRAKGFEMRILTHDPYCNAAAAEACGVNVVGFDELLAESDVLAVHTPLTPETRQIMNASSFARMKDRAFFVNMARGEVVDEPALVDALKSGKLAGAAIDVITEEPPKPDNPLLGLRNVIVTPHIGSDTFDDFRRIMHCVVDGILSFMDNKQPNYVLNPDVFKHERYAGWQLQ